MLSISSLGSEATHHGARKPAETSRTNSAPVSRDKYHVYRVGLDGLSDETLPKLLSLPHTAEPDLNKYSD